jgi:hypothetical protein
MNNSGFLIHGSGTARNIERIRNTAAMKATTAFSHKKVHASSTTVPTPNGIIWKLNKEH